MELLDWMNIFRKETDEHVQEAFNKFREELESIEQEETEKDRLLQQNSLELKVEWSQEDLKRMQALMDRLSQLNRMKWQVMMKEQAAFLVLRERSIDILVQ